MPGVSAGFPFPASPPGGQRALLYDFVEPGLAQCPQGCAEITVVDVPSGEPQWRVLLPQESGLALDFVDDGEYGGLAAIAVLEASGRVSVYDGNSSEPVSSMTVEAGSSSAALTSGELIVAYDRDGLMSVTGYSRATGERLWHVTPPLPPLTESSPWHYVQECGALVCATSGAGTTLLEPASGRVVATIGDHAVASADDTLIVSFGGPELSDPTPTVTLRSTADGRVIRQIPGTSVVGWAGADGRTLLAQAVDGGTRFVLVDRQGSTRVLGTIGDRVLTCAARDDLLACHQDFGQVRIWRLPLTDPRPTSRSRSPRGRRRRARPGPGPGPPASGPGRPPPARCRWRRRSGRRAVVRRRARPRRAAARRRRGPACAGGRARGRPAGAMRLSRLRTWAAEAR